jgi:hypothetical protein
VKDTPGSAPVTDEQRQWFIDNYGAAYTQVADGSTGGPIPGHRYGSGKLAATVKKRKR